MSIKWKFIWVDEQEQLDRLKWHRLPQLRIICKLSDTADYLRSITL